MTAYVETELKYVTWDSSTSMAIQDIPIYNHSTKIQKIPEQQVLTVKPENEGN